MMKQKWWVSMHLREYYDPWYNKVTQKLKPQTINNTNNILLFFQGNQVFKLKGMRAVK